MIMDKKQIVPEYKPENFSAFIETDEKHWKDKTINDFFISKLSTTKVKLRTPFLPHRKTVNDFVWVTKGRLEQTVYNEHYHLSAGSILLLAPEKIRTIDLLSEDIEGFYCHFSDDFIAKNDQIKYLLEILNYLDSHNRYVIPVDSADTLLPLLNRMERLNNSEKNERNTQLISFYLMCFLGELKEIIKTLPEIKWTANEKLVLKFKKAVTKNIHKIHNVHEYASMLNVTPNHLNKCVKDFTGSTASEFINKFLMIEAKAFLSIFEMSISEAAYAIGISDPSYFARFFKKQSGMTPREYRKMIDLSS
ncbi:AraC-type DNA-binding protein [Chryseobacterium oleae]|uniref:AraC-type DNA-binding protein n=2 Tax=Chryseobacterium oleae TaxID=491207 RepID=A0A1I4VDT0_CHROL|nr:AraC-type DNA-binding protein [Chryseobacterium oleae]